MKICFEGTDDVQVRSDPELLFSILENLLLNAFEAGGEGTAVQIRSGKAPGGQEVLVEVEDNGPGIATELLPDALFEPFKTTRERGSGIGLWQVKRIVTGLGGTITAENRKGGGARFVLRLPLA